jgi:hypothetical protein
MAPDMRPRIRLKKDMIGIHVPMLSRTALIDGPSAFELGLDLIRKARKLEKVHASSKRDADDALLDHPDTVGDEQLAQEHRAFVFEAMMNRLGIDPEDDLDLDEDFMEDPDAET